MDDKYVTLKNGKSYLKSDYVTAKTKDLQEFGYNDLTESSVLAQLNNVLGGSKLDVIGMFIKDDFPQTDIIV